MVGPKNIEKTWKEISYVMSHKYKEKLVLERV
jgi:hypothetical protein